MCGNTEETDNHYLRCKSYQHTEYDLAKSISKILHTQGVDPHLKILLLQGMGIGGNEHIEEDIPSTYHPLIQSQGRLGWDQLWYSRWSKRWGEWQLHYEKERSKTRKGSGNWIQRVMSNIWEHTHGRWIQQGNILGGQPRTGQKQSSHID